MALRQIRVQGDTILEKECRKVDEVTPKIRDLIEDMIETMYDANGVGLAAPQVGVLKQIVVIDTSADGEGLYVLINPEILETSGSQTGEEGCLSVPGISGVVTRPDYVKVKAYDENPLDGFVFSNNGFLNLFLLMDETYNKKGWKVKHPSLPILFIAGADDPCIGSKKQYAQAMTTLKKRGYNQVRGMLFLNRRHEILNEDDVEKVYDAVLHFLEQHSKRDD